MLIILDGWGARDDDYGNAVALAKTPFIDRLKEAYPTTRLTCAGEAVGLPAGIMGNSEVGHLNIGAGRVVYQDLLRIDMAIGDGTFKQNKALNSAMDTVLKNDSVLHLMGLLSDGGVHSHINHLFALLKMAQQKGLKRVFVHPILDGRDTPPDSGLGYLEDLQAHIRSNDFGAIATVCGRFYAMDRDNRWDRIRQAYDLYTGAKGAQAEDPLAAVKAAYGRKEFDEFVKPVAVIGADGKPLAVINDGDGLIFFNFRADRAREITRSLTDAGFSQFERTVFPKIGAYVCMSIYEENFTLPVAFGPVHMDNILGEVISRQGLKQLRIAETEKYAHVTYFFNGGEETPFENEDRCLIPSPREVATYDEKPAMSAVAVTDEVLKRLDSKIYDLIVLNFANMDMVGHTGVLKAAIEACETVDRCLAKIVAEVLMQGGVLLVTADHGNAEVMIAENGNPHTAHSHNPVPLVLVGEKLKDVHLRKGILGDIAPTILHLLEIAQPPEMTGRSLISD